jgi:hypothetical protein
MWNNELYKWRIRINSSLIKMPYKDKNKQKEHNRNYYLKNKDKLKYSMKRYYDENVEKRINYQKNYNAKNKEKVRIAHGKDYQNNRDKYRKYGEDYYLKNKNKLDLKSSLWKKRNKDKIKKYREKNKLVEIIRKQTRKYKKDYFCSICGSSEKLQFHHIRYKIPVEKKDIQTLCNKCHNEIHKNIRSKNGI